VTTLSWLVAWQIVIEENRSAAFLVQSCFILDPLKIAFRESMAHLYLWITLYHFIKFAALISLKLVALITQQILLSIFISWPWVLSRMYICTVWSFKSTSHIWVWDHARINFSTSCPALYEILSSNFQKWQMCTCAVNWICIQDLQKVWWSAANFLLPFFFLHWRRWLKKGRAGKEEVSVQAAPFCTQQQWLPQEVQQFTLPSVLFSQSSSTGLWDGSWN
jgi:hypothetical protein